MNFSHYVVFWSLLKWNLVLEGPFQSVFQKEPWVLHAWIECLEHFSSILLTPAKRFFACAT